MSSWARRRPSAAKRRHWDSHLWLSTVLEKPITSRLVTHTSGRARGRGSALAMRAHTQPLCLVSALFLPRGFTCAWLPGCSAPGSPASLCPSRIAFLSLKWETLTLSFYIVDVGN